MVVPGYRSAELSLSQIKVKIVAWQECKLVPTVITFLYLKKKKIQPNKKKPHQLFKTYSARHVSVYYKCQTGRIILPMFWDYYLILNFKNSLQHLIMII